MPKHFCFFDSLSWTDGNHLQLRSQVVGLEGHRAWGNVLFLSAQCYQSKLEADCAWGNILSLSTQYYQSKLEAEVN